MPSLEPNRTSPPDYQESYDPENPPYCQYCGNALDYHGDCSEQETCPGAYIPCPVCVDFATLSADEDTGKLTCDYCEREFEFYDGELSLLGELVVHNGDAWSLFEELGNKDQDTDMVDYWRKVRHWILAWDKSVMKKEEN